MPGATDDQSGRGRMMPPLTRSPLLRYGMAVAASGLALLLALSFRPFVEPSPFLVFLVAVVLSAWAGGLGPGLLATLLSLLASAQYFLPPVDSLAPDVGSAVQLTAFVLVALLVNALSTTLRRAQRKLTELVEERAGELAKATDALRAEMAERGRADTQFRELLESAPDAIVIVDREGTIVLVNAQTEQFFGYDRAEMIGRPVELLLPDHLRDQHVHQRAGYAARPRIRPMGIGLDLLARRKDGTIFPVEISLSPSKDGSLVTSVIHDIAERKRAEAERVQLIHEQAARAAAEAAEQRFRFLAEASTTLVASLDYVETLTRTARLAVPTLGDWCAVDVLEEDGAIHRLAVAHADPSKEALAEGLQHRYVPEPAVDSGVIVVLQTGQSKLIAEVSDERAVAVTGDAKHLRTLRTLGCQSAMCVPLQTRERIIGVVTFVSATANRRYGPADLALAEDLAHRAALALDNARLYREAREAVYTRDEFLSSISHDLKNPLAAIKGHAQLLRRRAARGGAAEIDRIVEGLATIDATATKMAGLINQLLDVARLQIGQALTLDRQPTNLVELARQAVAEYQQATESHHLRLETTEAALGGNWDTVRLERVLGNLLSNAIKYSPTGGEITVRLARKESAAGLWAVLDVQDQGLGIPAADLPHVFKRFHRGKNVVKRITGTGIGLAAAWQVVEQHGGTIDVESQEGVGSTFSVRLPLLPRPSEEARSPGG